MCAHTGIVDRNKVYVSSPEEKEKDEAQARVAALIAVAVLLGPIALIGGLASTHGSAVQTLLQ